VIHKKVEVKPKKKGYHKVYWENSGGEVCLEPSRKNAKVRRKLQGRGGVETITSWIVVRPS